MTPRISSWFSWFFVSLVLAIGSFGGLENLRASVLTTDSFSNRLLQWDGTSLSDAFNQEVLVKEITGDWSLAPFQPPLVWKKGEILFFTNKGEILLVSLSAPSAAPQRLYASEDECRGDLGYSGCLYSMTLAREGLIYFVEHQRDGSDTLKSLSSTAGVKTLVTDLPAQGGSGPLWMKANGNVGVLPYGHGLVELKVPSPSVSSERPLNYQEALVEFLPVNTMGAVVYEGKNATGKVGIGVFDYTSFKMFSSDAGNPQDPWKILFKAISVTANPCSGNIWFLNARGKMFPFSQGENQIIPPNAHACPTLTHWNLVSHQNPPSPAAGKAREDFIQGYPSGRSAVPSEQVYSLGSHGQIVLSSSRLILDGPGPDLRVFENAFKNASDGSLFTEPAQVELYDEENNRWSSTGCDCQAPKAAHCAGMQVTHSYPGSGIAPWSAEAGGFSVDLETYSLKTLRKIRITDCGNEFPGGLSQFQGFDLDAVIVSPTSLGK